MPLHIDVGIYDLTTVRVQQRAFTAPALPQGCSFLRAQIGVELYLRIVIALMSGSRRFTGSWSSIYASRHASAWYSQY